MSMAIFEPSAITTPMGMVAAGGDQVLPRAPNALGGKTQDLTPVAGGLPACRMHFVRDFELSDIGTLSMLLKELYRCAHYSP